MEEELGMTLLLPVSAALLMAGLKLRTIMDVTLARTPFDSSSPVFTDITYGSGLQALAWLVTYFPFIVRTFHTNLTKRERAIVLTDDFLFNC